MKIIIMILTAGCLSSCNIPVSQAVQAHAAGEQAFSPVSFAVGAKGGPATAVSSEASKSHDFWGGAR